MCVCVCLCNEHCPKKFVYQLKAIAYLQLSEDKQRRGAAGAAASERRDRW